ncbi:hypothetical protein [Hwangdonia lutea]|uniref:Uncharacterized protein n=1 Tax=Hwangdonia lutea TaxID=3075823 RepID=A0AA97HSI3_9FLAO|nr:hypothetical protein [Hwangdonia sp. SCSIO 19198]WOD44893.1 hypothetical protein RNZ46_06395 [Hwangdonia sp. SCSIO 19198]
MQWKAHSTFFGARTCSGKPDRSDPEKVSCTKQQALSETKISQGVNRVGMSVGNAQNTVWIPVIRGMTIPKESLHQTARHYFIINNVLLTLIY